METFETDGIIEALATLAKKVQTLTESIESAKFIPPVRKEQRQQDMEAILITMKQAIRSLDVHTTAEIPEDAKEALIDFNNNLKLLKRRPLFDGKRSRRLSIGSLIVALVSLTCFFNAKYEVPDTYINSIFEEGKKKKIEPKDEQEKVKTLEYLRPQLKALIARDLWDLTEYFHIWNENSDIINKALEVLGTNSAK